MNQAIGHPAYLPLVGNRSAKVVPRHKTTLQEYLMETVSGVFSMPSNRNVFTLLLLTLFLSNGTPTAHGEEFDFDTLQANVQQTIDNVRPAVVSITGRGSAFSGVIVSGDGHVLSAAHAVSPGVQYRITLPDGRRFRGVGKGSNRQTDAALIKITNPGDELPHVPMGDSSSLVTNQPCVGLSYPGGQKAGREPVARFGRIVRTIDRRGMLQSSALMEPGDSGGPLFDLNGYVIGIHSRIGRSMDRNYEVSIDTYRKFWNELNREQEFVQSGPPRPVLGVLCRTARNPENRREVIGLTITEVVDGTLAAKAGIKVDDTLTQVYGRRLRSKVDLRKALVDARDEGVETLEVKLQRSEESIELAMEFDVEREGAPEVPLPADDHPSVPTPDSYRELSRLPQQLAELESKLDDACVEITSDWPAGETARKRSRSIIGTRIQGTPWLVSKSSVVGQSPRIEGEGKAIELDIIQRDRNNDLILLKAPEVNTTGIELEASEAKLKPGAFLLTPDEEGAGFVSVVASSAFRSRKQSSRGFLGVQPETYKGNKGVLLNEVTNDGAAKRSGLLVGDVITKLNDTIIRTQRDLRTFLSQVDPNTVITATLRRDDNELTKSITLGAPPTSSNHAADQMRKSSRRDGFSSVFIHDANLKPGDCGGPLFDLQGNLVGLNIARNSRVRSYALPTSTLQKFVATATANATN